MSSWRDSVPVVLVFMAFVAPGAWLVVALPPIPVAKALTLLTVAVWFLAIGSRSVPWSPPDRPVLLSAVAVAGSVALSLLAGGSLFQSVFYDLYGNMPLLQWLAFPALFVLASGLVLSRARVERALVPVVAFGAMLAVVEAYQWVTTATPRVFGSTGYSTAALATLIPIAVSLAAVRTGPARTALYAAAGVIALDVGFLAGSTMGVFAVTFAALVSIAIHPAVRNPRSGVGKVLKSVALSAALLMVAGMLVAQVPAISGRWANPDTLAAGGTSVISRLQMWQGAQDMLVERPVFGYGPSGYRMAAVEFLPPEALQYGPDRQGDIDPTVYSPQSPHSVLWEIGTRLGLVGILAFSALLTTWLWLVLKRVRLDDGDATLRLGLAAGLLTTVFSLSVDPVLFAVGLFAPVAAGLAVARYPSARESARLLPGDLTRWVLVAAGGILIPVAIWLGAGEWRLATAWSEDPYELLEQRESALLLLPGHPVAERQVLEMRLLLAEDGQQASSVQRGVDEAPAYVRDFAPNLVSLATYSLSQAERTGRSELAWEQAILDRAAERMPPMPSLVAEQLRLAVLSGDPQAVREAMGDAERWGGPYPFTDRYLEQARLMLNGD